MMTNTHSPHFLRTIDFFNLHQKRVFIRLDMDFPFDDPCNDGRLDQALSTIRFAMQKNAKIILAAHWGKTSDFDESRSLITIADQLAERLNAEILLSETYHGDGIELMAQNLKANEILLLENLSFFEGEKSRSYEFAKSLSRLAQIYINESFGSLFDPGASLDRLALMITDRGIGFNCAALVHRLEQFRESPDEQIVILSSQNPVVLSAIPQLLKRAKAVIVVADMVTDIERLHPELWEKAQMHRIPLYLAPTEADLDSRFHVLVEQAKQCFWLQDQFIPWLGPWYETLEKNQTSCFLAGHHPAQKSPTQTHAKTVAIDLLLGRVSSNLDSLRYASFRDQRE